MPESFLKPMSYKWIRPDYISLTTSVRTRCTLPLGSLSLCWYPPPTHPRLNFSPTTVANTGDSHNVGPPNSIVSLWLLAAAGHLDFATRVTRAALFGARPHKVLKGGGFLSFCSVSRFHFRCWGGWNFHWSADEQ